MRQEWVPYNGNGVQGGRAYAARFEDDVLFHRGERRHARGIVLPFFCGGRSVSEPALRV